MLGFFLAGFLLLASNLGAVLHIAHHCQPRKQGRVLKHHSPLRAGPFNGLSLAEQLSGAGHFKAGHHVQNGALAALSRAKEHKKLVFADLDVEVPHNLILSLFRLIKKFIHSAESIRGLPVLTCLSLSMRIASTPLLS